jgi:thioredoxin 2
MKSDEDGRRREDEHGKELEVSTSETKEKGGAVTVRCSFCLTLNRIDVGRVVEAERPRCGECERPILLDRPVKVSEEDFERTVKGAEVPVLVDFYADWCGPCKMVAPLVDEIAGEKKGRMLVAKVDTDEAPALSEELGIQGVPTLILFEDGEEVERSAGYEPEKVKRMADRAA